MKDQPDDKDPTNDYDLFKEEYATLEVTEEGSHKPQSPTPTKKKRRLWQRKKLLRAVAAIAILIALLTGFTFLVLSTRKPETTITINTQSLDNGTLNQLTAEAGGEARQQLTISPATLFKENVTIQGSAEIQQNLDVNGILTVEGAANLQGPTSVGGELTVGGNTAIGGNLSVTGAITAASLSVGSISISDINVSSDISFEGHLIPNGATPSVRPSLAASGGNVTVSGNDTAGTIVINVGGGPVQNGEMAIITFNKPFTGTPKVQLTPINSAASNLRYYATRNAGFFTVNTSTAPANGTSYVFDYFVTQ